MEHHNYIIIGAGPAGLQMAYFLERAGRDYQILEANGSAGSFFIKQPRYRRLLSLNKRFNIYPEAQFNLRHDWNSLLTDDHSHLFRDYSDDLYPHADALYRYLVDYAEKFALKIRYNTRVTAIRREDHQGKFILTDQEGQSYSCDQLLMATGPIGMQTPQQIEGIELATPYVDYDMDLATYQNKRVLIIGGGNSAFEVANHLAGHAGVIYIAVRPPLKMAWQTHFAGDLRAINNTILDMFQLKSQHFVLGLEIKKIVKQADGSLKAYVEDHVAHWKNPGTFKAALVFDHIIYCTGWKFADTTIFAPDIAPKLDAKEKYPVLTSSWESSTPDLFYLGTAMAARDRKAASSFIHGFRYNVRTLFRLLEARYQGVPLPSRVFPLATVADLDDLAACLVERVSTTDGLFPLHGFLCDTIVFSPGQAEQFYELPVAYIQEGTPFTTDKHLLVITLEFGFHNYPAGANSLDFLHDSDAPTNRACSAFLHPVFRHYYQGELIEESHFGESISVRYGSFLSEYGYTIGSESVEKNILMNLINRITQLTAERFPEQVILPAQEGNGENDYGFVPWPEEKRMIDHRIPICKFSEENTLSQTV
jgi:thioredoxin reductase